VIDDAASIAQGIDEARAAALDFLAHLTVGVEFRHRDGETAVDMVVPLFGPFEAERQSVRGVVPGPEERVATVLAN
jgi:hypothetical protein